jgi:hypothetical protein
MMAAKDVGVCCDGAGIVEGVLSRYYKEVEKVLLLESCSQEIMTIYICRDNKLTVEGLSPSLDFALGRSMTFFFLAYPCKTTGKSRPRFMAL